MTLMTRWAGYKFDAGLFKSFLGFCGDFPIGTLVRLVSGESAIMLPPENENALSILVLTSEEGDFKDIPEHRSVKKTEVKGEAPQWQDLRLPESFKTLRPDLMGLPRFYPSES